LCKQGVVGSIPSGSTKTFGWETGRHIILGRNKFADCSLKKEKSACSIEIVKRRYIRTIAPVLLRKLSAY
ncbi:hypothetical protein, partial [Bartonella sp. M0193]|uniref:hypothetical protein n=1 Tax=Bartonella sp. M0193 TaxID=2750937 RepID=UPI001AED5BA4